MTDPGDKPAIDEDEPPRSLAALHRLGPLLLLAAAGFGIDRLILALNRVPNSPEEYERLNPTLLGLMAAVAIVIAAGPVLGSRWAPLDRAHRFAGRALCLALVFWWLPIPFYLGRFLSWLLLYACAGVYLAITLRLALRPGRGPHPIPAAASWWAAAAAIAAVLLSLLSDKHNSLAFSMAID